MFINYLGKIYVWGILNTIRYMVKQMGNYNMKLTFYICVFIFCSISHAENIVDSKSNNSSKTISELREKADKFSKETKTFTTKGFYLGMPWDDASKLAKAYGINPIFIVEDKRGRLPTKEELTTETKNLVINTIFFTADDINKLYSFDGKTADFCMNFLKSYIDKTIIFPKVNFGTAEEFSHIFLNKLKEMCAIAMSEQAVNLVLISVSTQILAEVEKRGEQPFFYYSYSCKDGTVIRFYDGLNLFMHKNLQIKTTGNFD